jgi:hypothetical protein
MGRFGSSTDRWTLSAAHHAYLVLVVVVCRLLAVAACPTYDDAFITWRYARNAADGLGLVFNPGAPWEPVLGTTTPLFAWILTVCGKLGAALPTAALALGLTADAVSAMLIPRLFGRARAPSTWALLAFASLPPLVRISVGGMESPLFGVFALLAVVAHAEHKPIRAGIWSALTTLVRPEGVLLCAILLVAQLTGNRERRASFGRLIVPMLVLGGLAALVLTLQYGSPIPQSVVAKSQMPTADPDGLALSRLKTIWTQSFLPHKALIPALPFVAYGLWHALRGKRALRLYSYFALALIVAYSIARPHTWGWYYYVPLTAWTLWFATGIDRFACAVTRGFGPALSETAGHFGAVVGGAAALVAMLLLGMRLPSFVPRDVYEPFGNWARATSTAEPGARILASDIGIVGWHWRGVVLDSEGLVWPDALRYGSSSAILEALQPEYFVLIAERTRMKQALLRPDVFARYEPIARFNTRGDTNLAPTPEELEGVWTQDYIVYRRRAQ